MSQTYTVQSKGQLVSIGMSTAYPYSCCAEGTKSRSSVPTWVNTTMCKAEHADFSESRAWQCGVSSRGVKVRIFRRALAAHYVPRHRLLSLDQWRSIQCGVVSPSILRTVTRSKCPLLPILMSLVSFEFQAPAVLSFVGRGATNKSRQPQVHFWSAWQDLVRYASKEWSLTSRFYWKTASCKTRLTSCSATVLLITLGRPLRKA